METLTGRGAVVVGGGSGIGRGVALGLAAAGARVLVADIEGANAVRVGDEITAAGGVGVAATVDATDADALAALARSAATSVGDVHVVVHTVGVIAGTPLTEATDTDWDWFLELHLRSAVRTVNAFLPELRRHPGDAHVVLTASMAGLLALPPSHTGGVNTGLYTVAKHALVAYAEMLRGELAPEGVGVSVLCPGRVSSNLAATSARNRPDRYGGAFAGPPDGTEPPGAMPNEAVGPIVVRGILADRTYLLTHPEARPLVERRQQALLADFAFAADAADVTDPVEPA